MKIAEIDWQLFWHALGRQRFTDRDRWLGRWVFADDGVRMSMQSAPSETGNSVHNNRSETLQDHFSLPQAAAPGENTEQTLLPESGCHDAISSRLTRVPSPSNVSLIG